MALFQKSVLRKHLNELDKKKVAEAYARFAAHFGSATIQQNIRDAKEEEYQEGFVRDLFVQVLGYTLKPQPDYNFVLEKKNEKDSKKADGAVVKGEAVHAVIELKGTDTVDLDHVEAQAFGYKNNQKGCRYVVVSNFEKLRFYIDDSVEHLEWDLFALSADDFAVLYLCLQHDNLLGNLPAAIKEASVNEEKDVTQKLYKDYSHFKRQLYVNICALNPQYDKLTVYKKTQKLLDRFLFILFAEDKQLLPPNSIREILKHWEQLKDLDEHVPLYSRYQKYFGYMNTGHKGKVHEIFAYNGGLFAPDEVLDHIQIDDQLLYSSTHALSQYDFETDVDVNILGHIFEHSLNDVDTLTAEGEGKQVEKDKTRRKKDGVFYTPKYITKYIVENTVGKLCEEKKAELNIKDEDYSGGKKKKDKKALNEKLESYRQWLLQLSILDPACGSGAFLNQALEFLIAEHRKVDELRAKLFGDTIMLTDVENHILENNLFGVDLNEESVEIAKLSLWLRTAKKGRKLSSLNNNIKCGNSLIDDPAVAGDKAFKWEEEFKVVMAKGGFDVVVGNPPYVPTEFIAEEDKRYLEGVYKSAFGRINLYPIFYEKGINCLRANGVLGFITPYTILKNQYFIEARRFILGTTSILKIIDFKGHIVFEDAAVDSIIVLLQKGLKENNTYEQISEIQNLQNGLHTTSILYQKDILNSQDLSFIISPNERMIKHIVSGCLQLKEIVNFNQGIITGGNKEFLTKEAGDINKKLITGSDFNRYSVKEVDTYIIYDTDKLHRPRKKEVFEAEQKILLRQTGAYPIATIDTDKHYTLDTVHNGLMINPNYNIKYIVALLNSKLLRFLYESNINEEGKVFAQVKIIYIDTLPIKDADESSQIRFETITDSMLLLNRNLQTIQSQFLTLLQSKFELEKVSGKLEGWYELEFKEFLKELAKAKVKMSLAQEAEWLPYFTEQKKKALELKNEIDKTDKEIDRMVYELYGLTEEEVKIVEGR